MSADPVPTTDTEPPAAAALTLTPDGTLTEKATLQSEFAQAGAPRVSRPRETVSITAGRSPWYEIVSVIVTGPLEVVTLIGAPSLCTLSAVIGCVTVSVRAGRNVVGGW